MPIDGTSAKKQQTILASEPQGTHVLHPDFMALHDKALAATRMKDNLQRRSRFFHVVQLFKLTRGIDGASAEAGCFRGLASLLICHYWRKERPAFQGESHFMIDSFEGLSHPVQADGVFGRKRHCEGAFTGTSLKRVQSALSEFPDINIAKGWIPGIFDQLPEQRYRFVHVDVDLYEPTLDSLRYFYPRLARGGILVCDDYGPWPGGNWPGCKLAVDQFAAQHNLALASLDSGNIFFVKR